jgi:aerobic carbon-monoxide dehydrogenase medium subunit
MEVVIPKQFEYHSAKSLEQAIEFLSTHEDVKLLAGGQSLIPMMKLRIVSPAHVLDLGKIEALNYIRQTKETILIGSLTRDHTIEKSDVLRTECPLLVESASLIADPQVRNVGTIGGNLSHGDPANDFPVAVLALNASLVVRGKEGERTVDAAEFHLGPFETALRADEVLTEIRIPHWERPFGWAFMKLERRSGDFAITSVAVQLTLGQDGRCTGIGIALGAVGPTPIRAASAENAVRGKRLTPQVVAQAAQEASSRCNPTSDIRGTDEYKREMVRVLVGRAISLARSRAEPMGEPREPAS